MADTKITSLTALTTTATGDTMEIVDVSDTTMSANGTNKKITLANLLGAYATTSSPSFSGTVTLPTGLTGVLRADSGVVTTDTDVTDIVSSASESTAGKVEIATQAEINTGTDNTRAITPDGLAGSNYGIEYYQVALFAPATDATTGDGKAYFHITPKLNGWNLVYVHAFNPTAGTTGTQDIQIHNLTDAQDMLSTKITIDSTERGSDTAATAAVINTSFDDVATNDILRIDVDAAQTTAGKGTVVTLGFKLP